MAIYSRYLREIRAGLFGVGCRRGAFLHEIDGYERLGGADEAHSRKTLDKPQVRASRVQEHLHSWQPRTPPDAHNRQSRAFFDWFVDGAFRGGRPSLLQRDRPSMHGPLLW